MQVLHQNIGLDPYIFKTFLFLFKFFLFFNSSFKIFYSFLFCCFLFFFAFLFFFLVKRQTPQREAVGTREWLHLPLVL